MATGDLAADGGQLDESMIGVLVIVLVVLLSTGYVYLQQMQAPSAGPGGAANANNARAGGTQLLPGAGTRGGHTAHAPNAVSTVTLTRQQLRLHRSLPSRHGARTITICADALLQHKESDAIAWKNEDVSSVLGDLLQIADVYLLYVVAGGDDEKKNKEVIERIRGFIASSVVAFDDKTKRGLKIHKVLFCTTMTGKIAFVRQIEPQFHVEGAFSTLGVCMVVMVF